MFFISLIYEISYVKRKQIIRTSTKREKISSDICQNILNHTFKTKVKNTKPKAVY